MLINWAFSNFRKIIKQIKDMEKYKPEAKKRMRLLAWTRCGPLRVISKEIHVFSLSPLQSWCLDEMKNWVTHSNCESNTWHSDICHQVEKKILSTWPFLKTFYLELTILNRKNKWNIWTNETDWSDIAIKIVMQLSYFGSCTLNTEYRWERREVRFKDMEEKWCWFSYFIGCHALRWQSVHTEDMNYFFKQQYILKREKTVSESHIS